MSVYFTHPVRSPLEGSTFIDVSWHSTYSLLAVVAERRSPDRGMVFICHDEGELISDMCVERSHLAETISWHPSRKILAIGWSSGEITTCNAYENEIFAVSSHHQSNVNIIRWSLTGNHIISADKSGLVLLWQIESKGELYSSPVHQSKVAGQITHCILLGADLKSSMRSTIASGLVTSVLASKTGQLFLFNSSGHFIESEHLHATVSHLVYSPETSFLAALTKGMSLVIFSTQNNSIHKHSEAIISGDGPVSNMIWTLPGVLATCSQEPAIRFWDTIENDNYSLLLKDYCQMDDNEMDIVCSIKYDTNNGLLLAVTSKGKSLIWSRSEETSQWNLNTFIIAKGPVSCISWGSGKHLLATCNGAGMNILKEHAVASHYCEEVSAVQLTVNSAVVQSHSSSAVIRLSTDVLISGLTVSPDHLALWDGAKVYLYSLSFNKGNYNFIGCFNSLARSVVLYENNVYTVQDGELCIHSVVGVLKNKLSLDIDEVGVANLRVSGHHLVISFANGTFKMFDLKRREPKLICTKSVSEHIHHFVNVVSGQANSNGTLIGLIANKSSSNSVLLIMNHEKDIVKVLDFTAERRQEIYESDGDSSLLPESLPDNIKRDQLKLLAELTGCSVLKFYWDSVDHRLLLIEVGRVARKQKQTGRESEDWEKAVITLFVTQDLSYLFQDIKPLKSKHHGLVGCTAPSVYYMRKLVDSVSSLPPVERLPLRDFKGLEDCDPPTVKAVLSFSYHSTMGNMDEAFKDVKNIKSKGVWETLAMMCVKTHRLDVALICLGNMGNARAAKAVREAKDIKEEDAQLAVLAVHLGMTATAEELFLSSRRYDLLNQFYQNCGRWQKAVEVAELNDRLHLKNTYYNLAKHSESVGEIKSAIKSYEQSGTHRFEVVRMLINEPEDLSEYNLRAQDKEVQHYWAEHLECSGDLDSAIDQYRACGDYRSVARLLIFMGDTEEAIKVVEETKDKAAAYHVARVFAQSEDWYRVKKAVRFYTMAKCYSHAITVTKDFGMEAELMNLALLSTTEDKIDAAKYFETKSDSKENAILLYHRAGELSKALELCFQYRQYEVLQQIAEELTESTNPETVRRVAEYFIQQEQFEKAVQMLLQSHKLSEALEMCLQYNVIINEEMAEKLTPSPAENETVEETNERVRQLNALADGLVSQGSYHLAAMKYTQASNKLQAMKALLKSGDTERVVFFANVSRQKEIYIMAANYLQSLDWRSNPTIMKNIISFYTKGRALEMLSNFYDTCAKVEIEEYQNYEKALGALNEALLVLEKSKGKNVTSIEEKKTFLKRRLELITKFIDIRSSYPDSPDQSIDECLLLLNDPHIDTALRTGDVYAMIITHYAYHGDHQQAYKFVNDLRKRQPGVNLTFYIKQQTLDSINKALGTTLAGETEEKEEEEEEEKGGDEGSDDSIEEVVD